MRIWDIHPKHLCTKHLLAEHRELHGLWNILTKHGAKGGYSHHPETLRWVGKTKALYERHKKQVREFSHRGFKHQSPLDIKLAQGKKEQKFLLDNLVSQKEILRKKPCGCVLDNINLSTNQIIK